MLKIMSDCVQRLPSHVLPSALRRNPELHSHLTPPSFSLHECSHPNALQSIFFGGTVVCGATGKIVKDICIRVKQKNSLFCEIYHGSRSNVFHALRL